MNKYINLKLALNKLWGLCEEDIEAEIPEAFDFSRAREALYDLPTIEVSEDAISRAEGEWLIQSKWDYKCSACNLITSSYKANFCPHCGAKMKGADE